jgi:DNA gyrase subunit B
VARSTKNPPAKAKRAASDGGNAYTAADSLTVLEGLDGVRKRVAMYLGSTDSRAVTHCVYEILDNAVDEALARAHDAAGRKGRTKQPGSHIVVTVHPDRSVSVRDDGRGIPVDVEPRSGLSGVRLVFEKLHAGGKFGGGGYKVAGGLHGVGASVVNAVSSRLDVEVRRDGGRWQLSFRRGEAGHFAGDGPDAPFTPAAAPKRVGRSTAAERGTTVRFWPDPSVFQPGSTVDWEAVHQRAVTTAALVDGLAVELVDERVSPPTSETVYLPDGVEGLVAARLAGDDLVGQLWRFGGSGTYTEQAQVLGDDGKLTAAVVEREVDVDVALAWADRYDRDVAGYVNVVATPSGGTHVAGFERAVVKAVQQAVAGTNLVKSGEEPPTRDDILEGLFAAVSVRVPEPEFEGQTKEALGTAAVAKVVADVVGAQLTAAFGATRLKPAGRAVCEKVVAAGRARRAARERRDAVRKSRSITKSPLPAKLRDCRVHDGRSELFIVEGDSAGGSVGAGRDSTFQAYLPIRGKILNTVRAAPKAMLENAEVAAIIAALGVTPPPRSHLLHDVDTAEAPARDARYGKVAVLADADPDGRHIATLLLAVCATVAPFLVDQGRVYIAAAPLYRVTRSDTGEDLWCYSDAERDATLARLAASRVGVRDVARYKGLGTMSADELARTTLDPAGRRMRRLSVGDAARCRAVFDLALGPDPAPRREWIVDRAGGFDLAQLDM